MRKEKIVASAPGKIYLFGEHAVMYDKLSIATSVDYRIRAEVEEREDDLVSITSHELGVYGYKIDIEDLKRINVKGVGDIRYVVAAAKTVYENIENAKKGANIEIKSEISEQARSLGTSSAVTVATIGALARRFDKILNERELFDLGYKSHTIEVQGGAGSGYDIACASYGGTILFKKGGETIERISCDEIPLIYSPIQNIKISTPQIVTKIRERVSKNPEYYEEVFWRPMDSIVREAYKILKNYRGSDENKNQELGELMNNYHGLLVSLGVSTRQADDLRYIANESGAYGSKMTGGGGDNIISLVNEEKKDKVSEAIRSNGGLPMEIKTNAPGFRFENSS